MRTLIERAEIIREKGTNRSRFFRGEIDKYTWVDVGSSYLPSDLLAAFLRAQLEHRDQIQSMRRQIWETYALELASWAEQTAFGFRSSRRMRTELPHVLRDHAVPREQASIDFTPRGLWDSGSVPLSAATSVSDGSAVWWSPRRLSCHGRFGGSPVASSVFHRNEQFGAGQVIDAVRGFRC